MATRTEILQYVIDNYYGGSIDKASEVSGCAKGHLRLWLSGARVPQKQSIDYLIHCAVVPEFRVIVEYGEFDKHQRLQTQLKKLLGSHARMPGLYAFHDSMGKLLYVGKATGLLAEIAQRIKAPVHVEFPKGVKSKPTSRVEVVRYISAYDVGDLAWDDYPKHVESLILRISKPPLNKNIGHLERARPPLTAKA